MVRSKAEYRYSAAAIGRARVFFGASLALLAVLIGALAGAWQSVSSFGQFVGIALVVVTLATARAQLGRLGFKLRLQPDKLEVVAPLSNRSIPWSEIAEVRRIAAPRMFGPPVWACAVVIRGRRGTQPVFIFDSGLERAEQAFEDIVARSRKG